MLPGMGALSTEVKPEASVRSTPWAPAPQHGKGWTVHRVEGEDGPGDTQTRAGHLSSAQRGRREAVWSPERGRNNSVPRGVRGHPGQLAAQTVM